MARILALDIIKASHQHADTLGTSGIAMISAIACQWDYIGCGTAVCWSNSRLGERSGLSRNSIPEVRKRLIDSGWLIYTPDGRQSGHYVPKLPEFHAQTSAVECATGCQFAVQVVCVEGASTVQLSVQPLRSSLGSYIPMPEPEPEPEPRPAADRAPMDAGDLFHGSSNLPVPDSLRWMHERSKPWAKALVKAGAKIGPQNWPAWQGLSERHALDAIVSALAGVAPGDRWPDKVEEKITASRGQTDIGIVTARRTIQLGQK